MSNPPRSMILLLPVCLIVGSAVTAVPAEARQDADPDSILANLGSDDSSARNMAAIRILHVFGTGYDSYSAAFRAALLEGMEELAFAKEDGTLAAVRASRSSKSTLASIVADTVAVPEDALAADALLRIAEDAPEPGSRAAAGAILAHRLLFPRLGPDHRQRTLSMLERAAMGGLTDGPGPSPRRAIELLAEQIGEPAVPILRRLDVNGLVQDRAAAGLLRSLAARGYRGGG